MNTISQRKRPTSMIKHLKRRLIVVVSLLVFVLIFCFPVGIFNASIQHNLDEQQIALQQGQSDLLLAMLNQATNLKRYITTNDTTFLQSFTSGRQQYLLTLHHLQNQSQGSYFSETTTALEQVEKQVNAWYSTYAQAQITSIQSGNLAEARANSAGTAGSALFDNVRTSVAHLQEAVAHDFGNLQSRLDWNSRIALIIAVLLSAAAMIVLWSTFIWLIKALIAQLAVLKMATNQLGSGDLAARVQELRYDELNDLGQTFNSMAEDLATRNRELEGSNAAMYQLAAIVEYSGDAILGVTLQGVITSWNSSAKNLFGYTAGEVIGHSISLIIPPDRQEERLEIVARIAVGETVQLYETTRVRKDGTPIEVSVTVSPIRDHTGIIIAASIIFHDISIQKRMVAELMALNSNLEEANRVRDQFLATMSHELRTPLTSIIGFSEMLLDDTDEGNQQQHDGLKRILKNGQHLLSLINDVLDLSKIEAGRMVLTYSQIHVQELLTSVVEEIQSMAVAQHLVLRVEVEDGIDILESHPLKLRQILLNLVSNAIKFTEQGEVTVSATRVISEEPETDQIALTVKDTGIGISLDAQAHIFEAFYQADGSYTRKFGGTGLGLSIVSQLTALLGGTIAINSVPGQGSIFTVTLPIRAVHSFHEQHLPRLNVASHAQASTTVPSVDELMPAMPTVVGAVSMQRAGADRRLDLVLAIDDNPDTIVLIKTALRNTSFTVVGVQDPIQAMQQVQELRPCAIILDVMMPDLNGWEILHQLKANPSTSAIPVVMLSVIAEQSTGYVLGADDYLIKPFKSDVLLNTLRHVIATREAPSQAYQREAQKV